MEEKNCFMERKNRFMLKKKKKLHKLNDLKTW